MNSIGPKTITCGTPPKLDNWVINLWYRRRFVSCLRPFNKSAETNSGVGINLSGRRIWDGAVRPHSSRTIHTSTLHSPRRVPTCPSVSRPESTCTDMIEVFTMRSPAQRVTSVLKGTKEKDTMDSIT